MGSPYFNSDKPFGLWGGGFYWLVVFSTPLEICPLFWAFCWSHFWVSSATVGFFLNFFHLFWWLLGDWDKYFEKKRHFRLDFYMFHYLISRSLLKTPTPLVVLLGGGVKLRHLNPSYNSHPHWAGSLGLIGYWITYTFYSLSPYSLLNVVCLWV